MSYVLDFSTNPFTKKKQPEYYYDFGTGVKIPVENKKDSTQPTLSQNTKSTRQDEDTDEFFKGFNEARDERDSRVRNAYAERMKNKAEREMRVDAFLEGFNGEKKAAAPEKEKMPPKETVDINKVQRQMQKDDFLQGFNEEELNHAEKEFIKGIEEKEAKKYDEKKINLREAKRSVNYSVLPRERARRIAKAQEAGDIENYISMSKGRDLDNFIELESKYEYEKARQEYLNNVIAKGDDPEHFFIQQEAEMAATVASDEVKKKWQEKKEKIFNESPYGKKLNEISNALTVASLIPVLDTAADITQIPVDLLRGDYSGAILDTVGAIPAIGEVADIVKAVRSAGKLSETASLVSKFDDVATSSFKKIELPEEDKILLNQLKEAKVKLTEEDVLFVTKDKTKQILWLEKGNQKAGLTHILDGDGKTAGHAKDFQDALGISREEVSTYLKKIISEGDVVSNELKPVKNRMGYERIYYYKGKYYLLVGIGTNGFVSSAYPISKIKRGGK